VYSGRDELEGVGEMVSRGQPFSRHSVSSFINTVKQHVILCSGHSCYTSCALICFKICGIYEKIKIYVET
jgi:hypothetical protein